VFYLKYRPHIIAEIDNVKARETITRFLNSDSLPHAFLFIGQKGTGKTSTARILAKSINCDKTRYFNNKFTNIEPCNQCSNCKSIDNDSSPDVVEMDAASNRGIDEIKNLIQNTAFTPMHSRFRVFIIDEAHQITHDGFNVLLKTLEEPPASVIFILATTNPEKVPPTIISRCVPINFGLASTIDIKNMLNRIIKNEKLLINNEVIDLIAIHSDNSFRDAAKLLQELITQNKLDLEKAQDYIGIRGNNILLALLDAKTIEDSLCWTKEFTNSGGNVKSLISDLLNQLHQLLMIKNQIVNEKTKITLSQQQILRLMKLFNEAYSNLHATPNESIPLEIAIMEYYNIK